MATFFHGTQTIKRECIFKSGLRANSYFARREIHAIEEGFSQLQQEISGGVPPLLSPDKKRFWLDYVTLLRVKSDSSTQKLLDEIDEKGETDNGFIVTSDSEKERDIKFLILVPVEDLEEVKIENRTKNIIAGLIDAES